MSNNQINRVLGNPKVLSWLMVIMPIVSLIVFIIATSSPPEAPVADEGTQSGPPVIAIMLLMLILGLKITAVIGVAKKWYFTWVYQLIELNFLVFLMGLLLIIAVLTLELAFVNAIKIVFCFGVLAFNLHIKRCWITRNIKEFYGVPELTHT